MIPALNEGSLAQALGRVESAVEATHEAVQLLREDFLARSSQHEKRITALERAKVWLMGAAAAVGYLSAHSTHFIAEAFAR